MADLLLTLGPADGPVLLLAHGAGAAMDSPFLETFVPMLAERGLTAARFEFAYMAARRAGRARRPPPKAESLLDEYRSAVSELAERLPGRPLMIGGKSMGGRVASMVADGLFADGRIAGLVCLGYPFHPPKQPQTRRTAHLTAIACPTLIVQGERDPFGTRPEVEAMTLSGAVRTQWIGDGDHDFGPRGASGFTRKGNLAAAAVAVAAFATEVCRARG